MLNKFYKNIEKIPIGKTFTTEEILGDSKSVVSANRILNNMVNAGTLCRASRGRFYKPEQSEFGQLPISTFEFVKDLLMKDNKRIGYISGMNALNELGLTTQVPQDITLAYNNEKKAIIRNGIRVRFIKQPNTITESNIPLLRILDCMRLVKNIPDSSTENAIQRLVFLVSQLSEEEKAKIVRLAGRYTPQVRALTGAIIENYYPMVNTLNLRKSLNGLTKYQLGISKNILPNQSNWNIV